MREVDGYDTQGQIHDEKYLSIEQMRTLLGSIPDHDGLWKAADVVHANYYRPHIKMLLFSGLRIEELISLRWDDVVFSEESCSSYIMVREQVGGPEAFSPKTRAGVRTIYLTDGLAADLQQHRITQMRHAEQCAKRRLLKDPGGSFTVTPTDLVFTSPWGRRLDAQQFRRVLRRISLAAGITDDVHPHLLRHTTLTYWADTVSGNSKVFKAIAGWANREVSDRYVGVPRGALIEATKRFQTSVASKVI
jgi:integrase